jgi:hypothetical protein
MRDLLQPGLTDCGTHDRKEFSYHLIRRSSCLAFGRKHDAFLFLTAAQGSSGNRLIGGRRADQRCHVGSDRVGGDRLS